MTHRWFLMGGSCVWVTRFFWAGDRMVPQHGPFGADIDIGFRPSA